jgi:methylated-DNA-protein-cysteine methyltransferase-like protein
MPTTLEPESRSDDPSFRERVLQVVAAIPEGRVVSYGGVAILAGSPRAARGVGSVLNAHGGDVPWWRVVNGSGRVAPTRPRHAARLQRSLLEAEGVRFSEGQIDFDRFGWTGEAITGAGPPRC